MRNHWDIAAMLALILAFASGLSWAIGRSEQRAHEAKMASCTTTIPKTDSARVGAD